jgi:hypothetical protein
MQNNRLVPEWGIQPGDLSSDREQTRLPKMKRGIHDMNASQN